MRADASGDTRQLPARLRDLLSRLRAGLESTYGDRLRGLYLYGSMARGDNSDGSDVDVLIVLDEVPHYYGELERTGQLVSVSRTLITIHRWEHGDEPFLTTVRRDAIVV